MKTNLAAPLTTGLLFLCTAACDPTPTPPTTPEGPTATSTALPKPTALPVEAKPSFEGTWMTYTQKEGPRRFDSCVKIAREGDTLVMSEYKRSGWGPIDVTLVEKGVTLEVSTEAGPTVLSFSGDKVVGDAPKGSGKLEMERASTEQACVDAAKEKMGPPASPTATPSAPPPPP